jgi:hypothetical protein
MVMLRQVASENAWDIINERGDVIRSHLELTAATAEYERMTGSVARRTLAHVNPHSDWLDGFRAGYLAALQSDDRWVQDRVKRYAAPPAVRQEELTVEPYDFGYWALGLINGQPIHYPGLHGSVIAGQVFFRDEGRAGKEKRVLVIAQQEGPTAADVNKLDQAIQAADAEMGAIISAGPPQRDAFTAARNAGVYDSPLCGESYPRVQVLTVADLLDGNGLNYPGVRQNLTGETQTSALAAQPLDTSRSDDQRSSQ